MQGAGPLRGCSPGTGCEQLRDQTNGDVRAGTVIEVCGECSVARPYYLPAQRRVGRPERLAAEFVAGVVEARDAAPDVAAARTRCPGSKASPSASTVR